MQGMAVSARVVNWLDEDREPADLYQLLGRLKFDPDQAGLRAAVRAMYGELLPYQNHADPSIARRALRLLHALGEAEAQLTQPERLDEHHSMILGRLRHAFQEAGGPSLLPGDRMREWLRRQSVHPSQFEETARRIREACDRGPAQVSSGAPRPMEVMAERPPTSVRKTSKAGGPVIWAALAGGAVLLSVLLFMLLRSPDQVVQGDLLLLRGHAGEIHLLIRSAPDRLVEAVTHDYSFAAELSEYWSTEEVADMGTDAKERGISPSRVLIRGSTGHIACEFRLHSRAALIELKAIQLDGDPRSLAVVGDGRVRVRRRMSGRRTELASLIRIHPLVGETFHVPGRFRGWQGGEATIAPGPGDRRTVAVRFPASVDADFARFKENDEVTVLAQVAAESTNSRLLLNGRSIQKVGQPETLYHVR